MSQEKYFTFQWLDLVYQTCYVLFDIVMFSGFWTSHGWKMFYFNNELFLEIIQGDLLIVFDSRIFNCRYFSHGLLTSTRGNCATIENGSTFFSSDTDLFPFNCFSCKMDNPLSILILCGCVRFVFHLYLLLFEV